MSHLTDRDIPMAFGSQETVSCPLAGKRAASGVTKSPQSVGTEGHPEKSVRGVGTCEYFQTRRWNCDRTEESEFPQEHGLLSSRPIQIGKHEADIKHCCVSPCDTSVFDQLKSLNLTASAELPSGYMATRTAPCDFNAFGKCDGKVADKVELFYGNPLRHGWDEPGDCDHTGYGKRRAADTSEDTCCKKCRVLCDRHTNACQHKEETRESCGDTGKCLQNNDKTLVNKAEARESCGDIERYSCSNDKTLVSKCTAYDTNNNTDGDLDSYYKFPRSIDNLPQLNCLADLVEELHRIFSDDHVNVDYVKFVMKSYKSNPMEWRKYSKFDKYKYTRNLVDAGNDKFNLMILCWGEGHGSSVHDHADAHCFMKMLDGCLTETRYAWPQTDEDGEEKPLQVIGKSPLKLNEVCYINDSLGLHRVENSSYADRAVSLHLYSPPFNACSVFNERTGHKTVSKVTFWSKFGKREKKTKIDDNQVQELDDN
ncbi:hypothetical protein M8J77_023212 [Diaphorina citri]|nr:hypothetical protein M8J77_023212 [Diaphorina citri]